MKKFIYAFLSLLAIGTFNASADELHVAVAANFLGTLQKLTPKFEQSSGHKIVPSSGASGLLVTQIVEGAPFDIFLSADSERPKQLEAQGLIVPDSRVTYAIGTLVLWSPGRRATDQQALTKGDYQHLAIANPTNAPYGRAAQEVLTKLGIWDSLNRDHKIVTGESIAQAWQFAQSGNAEFAFVALSQVVDAQGKISGSSWLPPAASYAPIVQDAVILKRTDKLFAAQAFLHWLHADKEALQIITSAGYKTAN